MFYLTPHIRPHTHTHTLPQVRAVLGAQLSTLTGRRSRRVPLLAALEQRAAVSQREYDDIALAEKQVRGAGGVVWGR